MAFKDRRRKDARTNFPDMGPFWIRSAEVLCAEVLALDTVLFSFPTAGQYVYVHAAVVEVITLAAGGTPVLNVGTGTIVADDSLESTTLTVTDQDEIIPAADITMTTAAFYPALTGDSVTLWAAGKLAVPLVGAAANVPCLIAKGAAAATAGKYRVYFSISIMKEST